MPRRPAARGVLAVVAAAALACSAPPSTSTPPSASTPPSTSTPPSAGTPGPAARGLAPGSLAPDFSRRDLAGGTLRLSAYRGQVVLLDFWATWCPPCRAEMPRFVELQQTHGAAGLQILAISMDDTEPPVRQFVAAYRLNFPVARGDAALAAQYGGILGLPVAYLLDREGRIRYRHTGETDAATFDREIRALLDGR